MEKLIALKDKMHEHSETIGLILELVLVIAAIFVAVNGSLKKALSVYDKQKLKVVKTAGKADVKIQRMKNRETVRSAKRDIKTQRILDKLNKNA